MCKMDTNKSKFMEQQQQQQQRTGQCKTKKYINKSGGFTVHPERDLTLRPI